MSDRTSRLTAVLHAWQWPDAVTLAPGLEAVRAAARRFAAVQIVEQRERAEAAVGAAALVNAAVRRSHGDHLLVLTPDTRWSAATLSCLLQASEEGLALVGPGLWALSRSSFESLGGLDERFWSVGEVDDLAERARLGGLPVRRLDLAGEAIGPPPYPLRADVAQFLRVRNRLLTLLETCPPEALSRETAPLIREALVAAYLASGLAPSAFAIGQPAAPSAADLQDPGAVVASLLALGSVVDEITRASAS